MQLKIGLAAGPCAKCAADVRSMKGICFCAFCRSGKLTIDDSVPHCTACGAHMKPMPMAPDVLAGNIRYCCRFGVKLAT